MTSPLFQCGVCINYLGNAKCKAFPVRIPEIILEGKFIHTKPFKGDHGIQFEQRKKKKAK